MTLPLLVSLPHAGLAIPPEVEAQTCLAPDEVRRDGDEQAREIYGGLETDVAAFVTTDIARSFVDLNRAADDRRADGVVKTMTCFEVPIYEPSPAEEVVELLLERYYHPYHRALTHHAVEAGVKLGVDSHTMLAVGPPIGPGAGRPRPLVCLSNGHGTTCPNSWLERLAEAFRRAFGSDDVTLNDPFTGGYIVRSHAGELPWLQIEISRTDAVPVEAKRRAVRQALAELCTELGLGSH